jgi:hypothetical protein
MRNGSGAGGMWRVICTGRGMWGREGCDPAVRIMTTRRLYDETTGNIWCEGSRVIVVYIHNVCVNTSGH